MTNLIVISFKSEAQAFEASHKLVELESSGNITVYEKAIVKKDSKGRAVALQSETPDGLLTLSGMALGTLVGAFAGPVGLLVGMAAGTSTGAVLESGHFNFSRALESKVMGLMQEGTVAIIAEIYEDDPAFIDVAFNSLGATVFRSNVDYVHDEYAKNQVEKIGEKIAAERARIKSAAASEKSKIQQKITQLKEKRRQRIVDLKGKQKTVIAKIKLSMEEEKKSRLKNRINKHQTKIAVLEEKLKQMEH